MRQRLTLAMMLGIAMAATACGPNVDEDEVLTPIVTADAPPVLADEEPSGPADVDAARLFAADAEPGQWMAHGRTYGEQRFSPLSQITTENVANLGLAWHADFDTDRGQESTPLMIDGVLYVTTAWSKVLAYDAASGEALWAYDPEVAGERGAYVCCDVVNRGVAAWEGNLFLGALDGRLIALEAATGEELWSVQTTDPDQPYSITGAPRVVKDKVLIGNEGGHFGVRGYVSAYNVADGELSWRFYTTPGDPSAGFENVVLEKAADTWDGQWWRMGGGGTVSDAIAYDPELDLLYIGVGSGSPWNHTQRSDGSGDNLYLSSIVALDPDSGSYIWHYQTTPADSWGFGASQQIIIADIVIRSQEKRVVMQASDNGFFYTLDAASGELISADAITTISWASAVDRKSGKPVVAPDARYEATGDAFVSQQPFGGVRGWRASSFSPRTGLVYIPIQTGAFTYRPAPHIETNALAYNLGVASSAPDEETEDVSDPADTEAATGEGRLIAWNPISKREVWRVEREGPMNGGVLSTAGGLVFQGGGAGVLTAHDASSGEELWLSATQTGLIAAPISYAIDDEQYIAIVAGTGGALGVAGTEGGMRGAERTNRSRLLVYKLGGDAELPAVMEPLSLTPQLDHPTTPPTTDAPEQYLALGETLYGLYCARCHGVEAENFGILPDLRESATLHEADAWAAVVMDGVLTPSGMVGYSSVLSDDGSEALRAYVVTRANVPPEEGPPVSQ